MSTFLEIVGGVAVYYLIGSVAMGLGDLINAANNVSDKPDERRAAWLFCHVFAPLAILFMVGFAIYTVITENHK